MTAEPMALPAVRDRADLEDGTGGYDVEIVVPVFNEQADVARGVVRLRRSRGRCCSRRPSREWPRSDCSI
jgi:hypothetical protein